MNAVNDVRVLRYKDSALQIARMLLSHLERNLGEQFNSFEKVLLRDFKMQINEIEKIEKGRVK